MNNVQFDEQTYGSPKKHGKKTGGVVKLIISTGLAKDEKSANVVMIGLIIVLCIITFFALNSGSSGNQEIYDDPDAFIEP